MSNTNKQKQWIPCGECLPEKPLKDSEGVIRMKRYEVILANGQVSEADFDVYKMWWPIGFTSGVARALPVAAWREVEC